MTLEDFRQDKQQAEQQIKDILRPFVRKYGLKSVDLVVTEKQARDPETGQMMPLLIFELEAIF